MDPDWNVHRFVARLHKQGMVQESWIVTAHTPPELGQLGNSKYAIELVWEMPAEDVDCARRVH